MKKRNKKLYTLLAGTILFAHSLWQNYRAVEIVAVHQIGSISAILVKNFPFTAKAKINWWLKNKDILKTRYRVPRPVSDNFTVSIWLFGDGYKEAEKYDRLCFEEMKTAKNCIEKQAVFDVYNDRENTLFFRVYDGKYKLEKDGKITKIPCDCE